MGSPWQRVNALWDRVFLSVLRRYPSWRELCERIWAVKTAGHIVNLVYC